MFVLLLLVSLTTHWHTPTKTCSFGCSGCSCIHCGVPSPVSHSLQSGLWPWSVEQLRPLIWLRCQCSGPGPFTTSPYLDYTRAAWYAIEIDQSCCVWVNESIHGGYQSMCYEAEFSLHLIKRIIVLARFMLRENLMFFQARGSIW